MTQQPCWKALNLSQKALLSVVVTYCRSRMERLRHQSRTGHRPFLVMLYRYVSGRSVRRLSVHCLCWSCRVPRRLKVFIHRVHSVRPDTQTETSSSNFHILCKYLCPIHTADADANTCVSVFNSQLVYVNCQWIW